MNRNENPLPLLPQMTEDETQAFYRKAKASFKPEDAKIYEQDEETILLSDFIAELKASSGGDEQTGK
jgi:hypothetical protein